MPIYEFEGKRPSISAGSYIHPTAVIIGEVTIGEVTIGTRCWIGPNVTIRADMNRIRIADGSNIQDNCVIHGNTVLGPYSHIGHAATLHGTTLGEHVLVAINATILDGSVIGDWCTIAAGAVVAPRSQIRPRKMVMGVPGVVVGDVPPMREKNFSQAKGYVALVQRYHEGLREVSLAEATVEATIEATIEAPVR